jgi:hypothetical protein
MLSANMQKKPIGKQNEKCDAKESEFFSNPFFFT